MSEIPGQSGHALPSLQQPVCATSGLMQCSIIRSDRRTRSAVLERETDGTYLQSARSELARAEALPQKLGRAGALPQSRPLLDAPATVRSGELLHPDCARAATLNSVAAVPIVHVRRSTSPLMPVLRRARAGSAIPSPDSEAEGSGRTPLHSRQATRRWKRAHP